MRILDQTLLPGDERYLDLESVDAVAEAIRTLRVRGAPLIGIAAAMGVTLAVRHPGAFARRRVRGERDPGRDAADRREPALGPRPDGAACERGRGRRRGPDDRHA